MLIVLLIMLLAVPVIFLFAPRVSGGLMVPSHAREARALISGPMLKGREEVDPELALKKRKDILGKISGTQRKKSFSSRLTISKKLRYAQWPISPAIFYIMEMSVSIGAFLLARTVFGIIIQLFALLAGPIVVGGLLSYSIDRRFRRFDNDFPQLLLSIVGLLKTGMVPVNAIEAAGAGLDPRSLVRSEVNIMIDRMRMGIPEDRSIGSFGETILHPEIELFIQALLLSRRVGGGLSDTLERLAKQVRKRQYFRSSANSAVALQRASTWFILIILALLEMYIYATYPVLITEAWHDPFGWMIWQGAITAIAISLLWSKEVTKIKV